MARGKSASTVASTVMSTGRSRMMPASSSDSSKGSPLACISSMKSKSTMTWLTMTPMRLTMPSSAMKPKLERMTHTEAMAADEAIGHRGEDDERLDGIPELEHQRQVDHEAGDAP